METIVDLFANFDEHEKIKCMETMMQSVLSTSIKSSINKIQHKYPMNAYFEDFDQNLVLLLLAYCKQTRETVNIQYMIPILESTYRLLEPEFVGIWSFMQNLVVSASTKSKHACNILGTAIPAAKYTTIYNFVSDINIGAETKCPDGDVVFMFDNEQIIGKSWNVSAINKVKMSVIMNVAVAKLNNNNDIQKNKELISGKWMTSVGHEDIIADLCESADQLYSHTDDLSKRH